MACVVKLARDPACMGPRGALLALRTCTTCPSQRRAGGMRPTLRAAFLSKALRHAAATRTSRSLGLVSVKQRATPRSSVNVKGSTMAQPM
eukprot:3744041-Lingulodinium_polyedra.AAC.1